MWMGDKAWLDIHKDAPRYRLEKRPGVVERISDLHQSISATIELLSTSKSHEIADRKVRYPNVLD